MHVNPTRYLVITFNFFLLFFFNLSINHTAHANDEASHFDEDLIKERLGYMPCLFKAKYSPEVIGYLKTYTIKRRDYSQRLIGKTVLYFPLFEKVFQEYNLPTDLKYLAIVESGLNAKAQSRVGAGGLWQFMPATGVNYGLFINEHKDDRSDPLKSTIAAAQYLQKLYDRFGSWELALAAYNAGPGRVNSAIKRSRSKSFWKLKRFLPRETRSYVPGFIAATYLYHYHTHHDLQPQYPSLDMQLTHTEQIYQHLSYQLIQDLTGLPRYVIEDLNPAYTSGFIPQSYKGNSLTLPRRVMQTVLDYLRHNHTDQSHKGFNADLHIQPIIIAKPVQHDIQSEYYKSTYIVQANENIYQIANYFDVSASVIQSWNKLPYANVLPGQEIVLYHPNKIERWNPNPYKNIETIDPLNGVYIHTIQKPITHIQENLQPLSKKKGKRKKTKRKNQTKLHPDQKVKVKGNTILYKVKHGDTLESIADQYAGIRVLDIIRANGYYPEIQLKQGTKIIIKTL